MRLISRLWALWILILVFGATGFHPVCAQTVTILHSFGDGSVASDGASPIASLIQGNDGTLYGTTQSGGSGERGTAFAMTSSGTETILVNFDDGEFFNFDEEPAAPLIFGTDGNLYGTTYAGGTTTSIGPDGFGYGAIFKMTTAGQIATIHDFGDGSITSDGWHSQAAVVLGQDGNFYGTTVSGGAGGHGTVFVCTPAGAVTILHSFADGSLPNDGMAPVAALIQGSDGDFYGTTNEGGIAGKGVTFKITSGGHYTLLHDFGNGTVIDDGANPAAPLLLGSDGNFYGTTGLGGTTVTSTSSGLGTAFRMTPQGAVTILHSFGDGTVANDGQNPQAGLLQAPDGNFYGTTVNGGSASLGAIFEMTPSGNITILHDSEDGTVADDGGFPDAALFLSSDNTFYGTTATGGSANAGTVFQLTPAAPGNDTFANHFPVFAGPANPSTVTGTNFGATAEPGEPSDTRASGGASVWWFWTAPVSGTATVTTAGSSFDNTLGVYTGSAVSALTQIASAEGFTSSATFNAVAGVTYYLSVDGVTLNNATFSAAEGTIDLSVSEATPAPANDNFTNAFPDYATPTAPSSDTGTNFGATGQSGEPANTSGSGKHSIWWTWTAPGTGTATIDTFGSNFDPTLGVYTGSAVNTLTLIAANDDAEATHQSQVTFSAVAGTKYSISVDGYSNNEGNVTLHIAETDVTAPGNDNFVNRYTVTAGPGTPGMATGNNAAATQESGEPLNASHSGGHSAWWKWTAPVSSSVTIDTLGSNFDTTLGVYTGNAVNALTFIASNDDSGGTLQSSVTFNAVAGTTYQISVDGYSYVEGSITLHVAQAYPAPTITSFTPASGPAGTSVVLTGTHFTGATSVKFHGTPATFAVNSDTKITATVPSGTTTGTITVTNPSATGTSAGSFTVTQPAPTITGFTPAFGPVGTSVTITGTNLTGTTVVGFQGKHAVSFTVNGAGTQITTTVPAGAATGPVAAATPSGTAHSSASFTVTP